jgi:O-antigen/teichoic acid export membrane protein
MIASPNRNQPGDAASSGEHGTRVLANFTSLAAARVVGAALEFVAQVVVARAWGPAAFGVVAFGRSAANYFGILADPGLSMVGMRTVARRDDSLSDHIREFSRARALTTAVGALAMTGFALWIAPAQTRAVVLGYLLLVLPFGLSFEWLFKGMERMWLVAAVRVVRAAVFLILTVIVVSSTRSTLLYAVGEGFSWCVSSTLLYWYSRQYFVRLPSMGIRARIGSLIRTSLPIGVAWLLTTAYQLGAVVLLTYLSGTTQAGLYGAAQRPVIFVHGFGVLLGESLVATFVRAGNPDARGSLALKTTVLTLAVLLPVSIATTSGAASVVGALFGERFIPAAAVLGLLVWQGTFILLNIPFYVTLVARGFERAYLGAIAVGAAATIALDVLVIPRFGAVGAAAVAVVVELAVLTLIVWPASRHLTVRHVGRPAAVVLAVAVTSLGVAVLLPGPSLIRVCLSACAGWVVAAAMLRRPLQGVLFSPSPSGGSTLSEPDTF